MIEYDKFQMSLKRLEEQYENQRETDASLPELFREAIAESVIHALENRALAHARNMVLPKLLSGEIRGRPAEIQQLVGRT